MLTVKGKTIVFLTAGDLQDAVDQGRKTHQTGQDGPSPAPTSNRAAKPATAQPDAKALATAQLGAVVARLNEADRQLSQARALIAEAFALVAHLGDPDE